MTLADERVAAAELNYLAEALNPPCQLGPFTLTGNLARSATALLYTATGDLFDTAEGVLKLTGSAYAPILNRELALLNEAAAAGIDNIVRPLAEELLWLAAGGAHADRPAAAMPLPLLAGGDLATLAERSGRAGALGPALAVAAARPIAEALRGLLTELDRPIVHGDIRPQNVLLTAPDADLSSVTLIDLDAAHELEPSVRAALDGSRPLPSETATLLSADVRAFADIVQLLAGGSASGNHALDNLIAAQYTSLVDQRLWHDLAAAERALSRPQSSWLTRLRHTLGLGRSHHL